MLIAGGFSNIVIVVALLCEARPLIDYYALKKDPSFAVLPYYHNSDHSIHLFISGIGKINAAIATSLSSTRLRKRSCAYFLNVGIAGAKNFPLGVCCFIDKVQDAATGRRYYPALCGLSHSVYQPFGLITHDKVQATYPDDALVDMEGAGFFQAAQALSSPDRVCLLKVVSYHPDCSHEHLTPESVSALIKGQLSSIVRLVDSLLLASADLANDLPDERLALPFFDHWHFTQTQKTQLLAVLRRWAVVFPDQLAYDMVSCDASARDALKALHYKLNHADYVW